MIQAKTRLMLLMNRKTIFGCLLCILLLGPASMAAMAAKPAPDWQHWSAEQFPKAEKEGKLVLLDLSAEWCTFCKKMDATTYQDPRVLAVIARHYIPVRIEDEKSPELAARFRDIGRPGTIIFDGEGNELMVKRGYIKPQWMEWMLQAVVQENLQE